MSMPLTDADCDRIADAILRAAGSGIRNYTMPSTLAAIREAVRASFNASRAGDA